MKKSLHAIGKVVTFVRSNGQVATGRIDGKDERSNGTWIAVNTAPKGQNRVITKVRPAQLR